jgi:hypothetical protein
LSDSSSSFRVLLLISGGIAAYKSLLLIRELRKKGITVRCAMTSSAQKFITPLSVASLSGDHVYTALFSLTDEAEMGHIELSRQADVVVVVPATANLLAKMAHGIADDLVSTILMATDTQVMVAPSMNVRMWEHAATQRNVRQLLQDGIRFIGPVQGDMACGEFGYGRMVEPDVIVQRIELFRQQQHSFVLIIGSIPKKDGDGMLRYPAPNNISDSVFAELSVYDVDIWSGVISGFCSLPQQVLNDEDELYTRIEKEERTIFSLAEWVGDVPQGIVDIRRADDVQAAILEHVHGEV